MTRVEQAHLQYITNPTVETYEALGKALVPFIQSVIAKEFKGSFRYLEDAVGISVCKILEGLDSIDPSKSSLNWVYTIVKNTCIDLLRQRTAQKSWTFLDNVEGRHSPPYEAKIQVDSFLRLLSKEDQELCNLKLEELSNGDIAMKLNCSVAAVKSRWNRVLDRLREA